MILRYKGETEFYRISSLEQNVNIVIVKGDFPHKDKGFSLFLNEFVDYGCSYEEYTTIYREIDGGCEFSNDGSVYVEPTQDVTISVAWNDEDDRCEVRPEEVTVSVSLNGEALEDLTITADEDWKVTYTDCPLTDVYTVDSAEEVEGYDEVSISGTTITYTIPFAPEPTVEESLEEIYNALADIDERVYNLETQ